MSEISTIETMHNNYRGRGYDRDPDKKRNDTGKDRLSEKKRDETERERERERDETEMEIESEGRKIKLEERENQKQPGRIRERSGMHSLESCMRQVLHDFLPPCPCLPVCRNGPCVGLHRTRRKSHV